MFANLITTSCKITFKNLYLGSKSNYLKQITFTKNIIEVKSELVLIYKINKQSKINVIVHNLLTNKTEICKITYKLIF